MVKIVCSINMINTNSYILIVNWNRVHMGFILFSKRKPCWYISKDMFFHHAISFLFIQSLESLNLVQFIFIAFKLQTDYACYLYFSASKLHVVGFTGMFVKKIWKARVSYPSWDVKSPCYYEIDIIWKCNSRETSIIFFTVNSHDSTNNSCTFLKEA